MISSKTLFELAQNTVPFLFDGSLRNATNPEYRYIQILNETEKNEESAKFEFCIAAHFSTVATFVPTDVDLAIRKKLWNNVHHVQGFLPKWENVKEFKTWDESAVSKRFVFTPSGRKLSGHQGEWLSIAMGAYGCSLKFTDATEEVRIAIEDEVKNHEEALQELWDQFLKESSIEHLKKLFSGIASVAHNLGDLDRMFDEWQIAETDVLKRRVYRLGHEDARKPCEVFFKSGAIYQKFLAAENHRHFALREPKPLRKSSKFLLNYGPFLDEWGSALVTQGLIKGLLNEGELREIVEALIVGWKRLNPKSIYTSQGYARALCGIQKALGEHQGMKKNVLAEFLPPVLAREVTEGGLRTHLMVSQEQFEMQWLRKVRSEIQ